MLLIILRHTLWLLLTVLLNVLHVIPAKIYFHGIVASSVKTMLGQILHLKGLVRYEKLSAAVSID